MPQQLKSAMPTRKWWAATIVAIAGVVTTWLVAPEQAWTRVQTAALIAVVVQRAVAYLVSNDATPGGVPSKLKRRR